MPNIEDEAETSVGNRKNSPVAITKARGYRAQACSSIFLLNMYL